MATVTDSGLEVFPISVERYDQMVDAGVLGPDDKVELLRGVLSVMSPQGIPHAAAIRWLNTVLVRGIDPALFAVQVQLPLRLPDVGSEPEPDISIVAADSFARRHPDAAALVIEISDSSLRRDLMIKVGVYADAGIPELWVVDVPDGVVRIHRRPGAGNYEEVETRSAGQLRALEEAIPPIDLDELFAQLRWAQARTGRVDRG